MKSVIDIRRSVVPVVLAAMSLLTAACTLGKQSAPSPSGPSEFALSVTMTASPDQLPRDGSSQSVVTVTARDASGKPVAGQRFTLGGNGAAVTFSQNEVTTGADGRATFAVVAPRSTTLGNTVTIVATPIGNNFDNAVQRTVTIALTGPSNTTAPAPAFTFTPTNPEVQQVVTFDASTTTDEGAACGSACTYSWDFDDGGTATGVIATHTFTTARAFNVALTVTDAAGVSVTRRQLVSVIAAAAPSVTVTVSPNPPLLNQAATFTATATAAANHSVRSYLWNFGDGTSATTTVPSVTKTYTSPGTFVVTATATDDLGQTGVGTTSFTVGSGVTTSFTFSPTNPRIGDTVVFSATAASSAGASITSYSWDFGDNTAAGSGATTTHAYAAARTYVVRLTVTDSLGRTSTSTQNVTVQ